MQTPSKQQRTLGLFKLIMITVISVDSIRNIPIAAQYGLSLVTFYVIAGATFFLPLILITSRFASEYPNTGGSYLWIEAAFGKKIGFASIWLQWVYQLIWYPTIFAFIASTLASLIHPAWETNVGFILALSLIGFWSMTLISTRGIEATSWMSGVGAIVGTLTPMAAIILLAIFWLKAGHISAVPYKATGLIPNSQDLQNFGFFANILFSLMGLEVAAMHAGNVKMPEKTYRRAMCTAGVIILGSMIFSSLALCTVLPPAQIGLINGLMTAFKAFLDQDHAGFLLPWIGAAVILGGLGTACSWILGLARGLQVACQASNILPILHTLNRKEMPYRILILQGILYSLLISLFLVFPNINNAYWLLSALTSQFALLYYALLFCAAIKLAGGKRKLGTGGLLSIFAILTSIIGFGVGFIPPSNIDAGGIMKYELLICSGLVVFCLPLIYFFKQKQVASVEIK
ncbi:MAG: APC family permease [Gammaproteobacteria bacterium]|nr:APC family permease [Gammaproteobacteria bacterium]